MPPRPHVLLSVAASLDGYIDDAGTERLLLSDDADFDRVDEERARADAILVGAGTIRADDPRLEVRSAERRAKRVADARRESPVKVTVTAGGGVLDPRARFFTGDAAKVVYTTDAAAGEVRARLGSVADVVPLGPRIDPPAILADLATRGVERLMVEGGGRIHTLFLTAGLVDELHIVLAPFFVGDASAPRFTGPGVFPQGPARPMRLLEARPLGDLVLLRYAPEPARPAGDAADPAGAGGGAATRPGGRS
ncbi:RibD family protein [Myceligenerans pegani]|uniref:Dihydrofolate reductase family protein n=1 Tax=Myceligenerans pegani TaxID=2776917 RepID=A0ABR9N201_9MICO|nr:dihydrofolate reductase family protein [Myceligenerans sp. TRM 65318]MBE1877682.1 dihydrofolate reductase family protein [Myceligenerans sp. TRM 65318]MBE3019953.1 dihydrofolate reductase family protein [Myceligenerans sp. TRM 65318]